MLPGIWIGEDGKARWTSKAGNLQEALDRASRLHSALVQRNVHEDVLAQVTLLRDSSIDFRDGVVISGVSTEVWGAKADVVKTWPLAGR
jgi:hypothetical protein